MSLDFIFLLVFGIVLCFLLFLLQNSMRSHRLLSPEQERHYRLTPHLVLKLAAEHGKPGARSLFLTSLFQCLDYFALYK